jgi:copper(I)-binding protein
MARSIPTLVLLLLSSLVLGGCVLKAVPPVAKTQTGLTVEKVSVSPSGWTTANGTAAKSPDSAVYLTIANGVTPDRLLAAKVSMAKSVELLRTTVDQGKSSTTPVNAIDIPAHSRVELKPGGYHLMMVSPIHGLSPGDSFSLVLVFENAGEITVPVTVQPVTSSVKR